MSHPDHQPPCIERGCPNPSLMPKSEYCAYHARREPQAATDGPAADPIADLARRLRALRIVDEVHSDNPLGRDAADALERLARERDDLREWKVGDDQREAEYRAIKAERDALRAIVRAADAMERNHYDETRMAYRRARAAWKGEV